MSNLHILTHFSCSWKSVYELTFLLPFWSFVFLHHQFQLHKLLPKDPSYEVSKRNKPKAFKSVSFNVSMYLEKYPSNCSRQIIRWCLQPGPTGNVKLVMDYCCSSSSVVHPAISAVAHRGHFLGCWLLYAWHLRIVSARPGLVEN